MSTFPSPIGSSFHALLPANAHGKADDLRAARYLSATTSLIRLFDIRQIRHAALRFLLNVSAALNFARRAYAYLFHALGFCGDNGMTKNAEAAATDVLLLVR